MGKRVKMRRNECQAETMRYGGVSKFYRCPVCKKNFLIPFQTKGGGKTHWVYKVRRNRKLIYMCSYRCFHQITEGVAK